MFLTERFHLILITRTVTLLVHLLCCLPTKNQVAALLTNRVPVIQGGAEVLELSAKDTKTLYYMPTGGVRRLTLSTVKDLESVRLRRKRCCC